MGRTQLQQDAVPMTLSGINAFNVLLNEETKTAVHLRAAAGSEPWAQLLSVRV